MVVDVVAVRRASSKLICLAVRRVLEVAAEIAYLALRILVDADQLDLPGDPVRRADS